MCNDYDWLMTPVQVRYIYICFHRYDCEFVISEVNTNVRYFVKTDSGFKLAGSNGKLGKNISTKAAGSDSRLIVTSNYKFPEGSTEEAAALERDDENMTPPGGVMLTL